LTSDEAYAAIRHLGSPLNVLDRDKARKEELQCFHKSFIDYISDFSRSGFSPDIKREARELYARCTFGVIQQAPDGIDVGDLHYEVRGEHFAGALTRCSGASHNISLSWSAGEERDWDDNRTRLFMYNVAVVSVVDGIWCGLQAFYNVLCIQLLTTCFRRMNVSRVLTLHGAVFVRSCCTFVCSRC
jgi:hypothetical protein